MTSSASGTTSSNGSRADQEDGARTPAWPPHRVLSLDTSTRVQSIALLEGDEPLEQRQRRVHYNHGSTALAYLDALLQSQNLSASDVDLFVCGLGPGSFTGLRVGLATMKALARATGRPIEGVSSLAAMAYPHARTLGPGALVCAAIDARRREVYGGCWRLTQPTDDGQAPGLEALVAPAAFAPQDLQRQLTALLEAHPQVERLQIVGTGSQRHPAMVPPDDPRVLALPPWLQPAPDPVALATLGRLQVVRRGQGSDLHSLEPDYCRPSDAELNLARRQREQAEQGG